MTDYLFPVNPSDTSELLPHLILDYPEDDIDDEGEVREEVKEYVELIHPENDFDGIMDYIGAMDPECGVLVDGLNNPTHVIGYHQKMSEEDARSVLEEIEDRLGYELTSDEGLQTLSGEDIRKRHPKPAGWTNDGTFVAGKTTGSE